MGQFRYQIREAYWRDVYVDFDDDELEDYIRELREDGRDDEYIRTAVYDWLKEHEDSDYGDGDDYETLDCDYDIGSDDSVYNVADEFLINYDFDDDTDDSSKRIKKVLGGLEDDVEIVKI